MSSEEVNEVINEEATKETSNEEINEEVSQPKEDASPEARVLRDTIPIAKAKPKAVPKKLARSVKVVDLVGM